MSSEMFDTREQAGLSPAKELSQLPVLLALLQASSNLHAAEVDG